MQFSPIIENEDASSPKSYTVVDVIDGWMEGETTEELSGVNSSGLSDSGTEFSGLVMAMIRKVLKARGIKRLACRGEVEKLKSKL